MMKTPTVRFAGAPEILFNLGSALNCAQYYAHGDFFAHGTIGYKERYEELAEARQLIGEALKDKEFPAFIDQYQSLHADTPTHSNPGGSVLPYTLQGIANYTSYFGKLNLPVRAKGYKTFESELLHQIVKKLPVNLISLRNFLDAIRPTVKTGEGDPKQAWEFHQIMADD